MEANGLHFLCGMDMETSLAFELLKTFATPITAGSIAIWGILSQRKSAREKNTLDFETAYQNNEKLRKASSNIRKIYNLKQSERIDVFNRIASNDSDDPLFNDIIYLLNVWERGANGVRKNILDEQLMYNIYGTIVIYHFEHLSDLIDIRRASNKGVNKNKVWINFEWLAVRWKIRRYQEDKYTRKFKSRSDMIVEERNKLFDKLKDEMIQPQLDVDIETTRRKLERLKKPNDKIIKW